MILLSWHLSTWGITSEDFPMTKEIIWRIYSGFQAKERKIAGLVEATTKEEAEAKALKGAYRIRYAETVPSDPLTAHV